MFSTENIHPLFKGRSFYRVFWEGVSPKDHPKANSATPWRFSPFTLAGHSQPIQGLYFADSAVGAMRETLFRKGQTGAVPLSSVQRRHCIEVELKRDLQVYLLTSELLKGALGFDPVLANDYPVCLKIAKLLAAQFPQIQGILFHSYQTDANSLNLVTWSHNTSAADFRFKTVTRDEVLSPRYRSDLIAAASMAERELSSQVREYCSGRRSIESLSGQ